MKILYVITGLGLGGAERVTIDLAGAMHSKGHQVKIAYLRGKAIVKPKASEIELVYLGLERPSNIVSASQKYRQLIKEFKPDVVHSHMVHANIFTRLNRLWLKIPKLVSTAHNSNEGGKFRILAYRLTHYLADVTTNVSKEASQAFITNKSVKNQEILTIHNGIDINKYNIQTTIDEKSYKTEFTISNHEKIFLSIGRFHEQKDYSNLLTAINIFKNTLHSNQKAKFLIAGDGELRPVIENKIKEFNLENDVILLGNRQDIPELLNIADYFISSSKYEGLPTVVIEAMACQCFVIATDCGGTAEILENTGLLVPPQNSEALAKAIASAIQLPAKEIKVNNQKARQRVEELFSLESSVKKWLEIYESK